MNPHTCKVELKRLSPGATIPTYGSDGAAGMDICADIRGRARYDTGQVSWTLFPGDRHLFMTGFAMSMWEGYEAQVRSRSGLALKNGIIVLNAPGTIDSDYRGEVGVILYNASQENFIVNHGDRIAQMVFAKVYRAQFELLDIKQELDQTQRGEGGFGSTGVRGERGTKVTVDLTGETGVSHDADVPDGIFAAGVNDGRPLFGVQGD